MPRAVYVLALGIFAMVTSEFAVAGLMPQMAAGLHATVPQIGYLITAFAAAMAAGGPLLTVAVMKLPPRTALLVLFAVFLAGNVLAATATGYGTMLVARIVTGVASQAFFGVALSLCARLTRPEIRGRAVAVAMNGLMLGTLLGLPLSTLIGERPRLAGRVLGPSRCSPWPPPRPPWPACRGWTPRRAAACAPRPVSSRGPGCGGRWPPAPSVIGATFSAFSYFNPILTGLTGFSAGAVPLLLIAYGAATVVGNTVVGRLADRYTLPVLAVGLLLNALFLAGFAVLAGAPVPAVACMLGVGLVGVTMNPAMVTRVQRAGNAGPLVNTVHSSFITLGVIIGSSVGAVVIDTWGLRAPLWLGAALAATGLPHGPAGTARRLCGGGCGARRDAGRGARTRRKA